MSSVPVAPLIDQSIASVQLATDGTPRFRVEAWPDHPRWEDAAADELAGGVSAELRIFLDAQLEAGDVLVDVAPGFGFVALSAATAPGGVPNVFAMRSSDGVVEGIARSARDVGTWVETFEPADLMSDMLATHVAQRIDTKGRVFVHSDVVHIAPVLHALISLVRQGRVVACCLSATNDEDDSAGDDALDLLRSMGFRAYEMRESDGEPQLFAVECITPSRSVIALTETSMPAVDTVPEPATSIEHSSSTLPSTIESPAQSVAESTTPTASTRTPSLQNAVTKSHRDESVGAARAVSHDILAPPSFAFIAPACRTGYGVVGAHLLREFLQLDAPVAYFPIGQVDQSIARTDRLGTALARQGAFDDRAPSVRLSQQFDLALHVGRGPRIGFPIFELDRFHAAERHHLERQDRILVTCEWARTVLLENGIWRTPIDIVPLGVDRAVFSDKVRPATARGDATVFMSVGKLERRKGQRELLAAFEAAFTPKDAVKLVLICHNPFVDEATFKAMTAPFRNSRMAARITIVTNSLPTQTDLAAVMATADCGVFPVRAEGWNLEALEMLSMGKAVIATACTAHTAFMNTSNARLIEASELEESVPSETRGRWAAWGATQHEQLVHELREVHRARVAGTLGVNANGIATATTHSWTASARALLQSVASA